MRAREAVIQYIKDIGIDISDKDYYQFGIFTGQSFIANSSYLRDRQLRCNKVWGFDSWVGLPEETEGVPVSEGWLKGRFSSEDYFKTPLHELKLTIAQKARYEEPVEFVDGFFEDSLTDSLATRLRPAFLIDIDVDLYNSTVTILEYLLKHNIIRNGTFIYFDDWGGVPEYTGGESLAFKEWTEANNLNYRLICSKGKGLHVQKVFEIVC